MKTLYLQNLVKIYNEKTVVNSVSLDVESSSVVGLLGPNGAGKTTTFYMTIGIIKPDEGKVFIDDEDITDCPIYIRARKGVGYLPQEPSIFRKLSVKQNILAILEALSISKSQQNYRVNMLLDELGIKHLANQKANMLSGGERRRLEITRALAANPSFILLDEPFAGIDPLAVNDIQKIIRQLKNRGLGVIISDHNVRETLNVCDKAYIINQGRIIEQGAPNDIVKSELARSVYLGENFNL